MSKEISEEEKWNALINCNKQYDGLFFYAVKTTGVFCRPACKAKAPLKKNILFFNNADEAIRAGFRPCKLCQPDKQMYEPNLELAQKVKEFLDQNYKNRLDLTKVSQELGVSQSHLTRLFKEQYRITPNEYVVKVRIANSMQLLTETDLDILAIAYEVGFESLSYFYKAFKERVRCTPKEYRNGGLG